MRTEMTVEVHGTPDDAEALIRQMAEDGTRLSHARIQGRALDVGPFNELADQALKDRSLVGIDFASDEAAELAIKHELVASDFDEVEPSGQTGYTTADVRSLY